SVSAAEGESQDHVEQEEDGDSSPLPRGPPMLDGWLQKRSQFLKKWHWRYVRITPNRRLQTFTGCPGTPSSSSNYLGSPTKDVDLKKTEDLDIRGAEVAEHDFRIAAPLPFGFIVTSGNHTIRLAAESFSIREAWLRKLRRASGLAASVSEAVAQETGCVIVKPLAPAPPLKTIGQQDVQGDREADDNREELDEHKSGSPPGKAVGKGAKGKGKGKGPPPPPGKAPPPKAQGFAKGSAKAKAAAPKASELPIGRRLSVRPIALAADAEAFMAMHVEDESAPGSASSSDAETGAGGSRASHAARATLDPAAVNLDALRSAFAPQPRVGAQAQEWEERQERLRTGTGTAVELLPRDAAQNVAIVLRKLRLDTEALAGALGRLEPGVCPLGAEEAERFVQVLPAPEVLRPLASYGEANGDDSDERAKLRDVERQLLPLAMLTRLPQRLRLLILVKTLGGRLGDAIRQMSVLQGACNAVRGSVVLRNLLQVVLVLFNYVNFGEAPTSPDPTSPARVRNVDVQSLMRLKETQAYGGPFPRYHMLHFCLQELTRQCPELQRQDLQRELGALPAAASVSLMQLQAELARLREDLAFVRAELNGHSKEYAPKPPKPPISEEPEKPPEPEPLPLKEASPEAQPIVGPVEFCLDDLDTASEDEEVSAPTEARHQRRTLLERLLAAATDAASFAEDWRKGNAVLGQAEPTASAVFAQDGEAPPPGLLWRLRPSGKWRRYFCEVRASLLVLYRIEGGSKVLGTSYVVLPGAEVAALSSLFASEQARELAAANPHGFEVRPCGGGHSEILRAQSAREAERWIDFLESQTQQEGVGYLSLHVGGWTCWRRLFCVIQLPEGAGDAQLPVTRNCSGGSGTVIASADGGSMCSGFSRSSSASHTPRLLGFSRPRTRLGGGKST
ncbi:unnamed protein product, partial [Polarella glacialis]